MQVKNETNHSENGSLGQGPIPGISENAISGVESGSAPDLPTAVMRDWTVPVPRAKWTRGAAMRRLLEVNKELWLIFTIFVVALVVNYLVSSQRLMLSFYTLPTIFSAYYFGRRHATLTAVFTSLLTVLILYSRPAVLVQGSTTVFEKWFDLATWSGFLILTAYAMGTLYETQSNYIRELRQTYDGVLMILQQFIVKDKYTQNHSYRVSVYAARIAGRLGMDMERIEDVRAAALLHDIGKLDISRDILYKAARLTEEEMNEARSHLRKGVDMLKPVGGTLRRVLPIILARHQSSDLNSAGGAQIPLESRIIAVADIYDALTTDRPYRKALSPMDARNTIVKDAGTMFDPRVVEAFTIAFNKGELEVPEILV